MRGGLINDVFLKYPFQTTGFEGECSKRVWGVSKLINVEGMYDLVPLGSTEEIDLIFDDGYNLKITGDIYTGPKKSSQGLPYELDERFSNIEFKHLDGNGDYLTNYANFDNHIRGFFEELKNIARTDGSPRIPIHLEISIHYESESCEIVYYPPLNLVFTINAVKDVKKIPVFYQMSFGYTSNRNVEILTNIIDLCLEVSKRNTGVFVDILNREHANAIAYFANYGIAAQYMAYVVIIFLASVESASYNKSAITLLLRHTPSDVLNYFFDGSTTINAKRSIIQYISKYHPDTFNALDPHNDLNELLDSSIYTEDNKDTFFGSTFFNIADGVIFEYRLFKAEIKNKTLTEVPSGLGVKKSVKNKISRYNMARRHKHTAKCRTKRSKCPLRKTRRHRLRGG